MSSFDIVSRLDLAEVDNALAGLAREVTTRFDFKGSKSAVTREELALTILADDDMKLRQLEELLKGHMVRRKIDPAALDFKPAEKAAGQMLRQVEAALQGEELRVSGKKRDDLQAAIQLVRGLKVS